MITEYDLNLAYSGDMCIFNSARIAHEANAALCRGLGDNSQKSWIETSQNIKDSAIDGVVFHMKNPKATPENCHENWLKGKEEDGWVYGAIKDISKKEHPCMIPYEELDVDQKIKDHVFRQIVHSAMRALGLGRVLTFSTRDLYVIVRQ